MLIKSKVQIQKMVGRAQPKRTMWVSLPMGSPLVRGAKGFGVLWRSDAWLQNLALGGFHDGHATVDQLYTLNRVYNGVWEVAQAVYMCFVDLEKAFNRVPRGNIVRGAPGVCGIGRPWTGCSILVRPVSRVWSALPV